MSLAKDLKKIEAERAIKRKASRKGKKLTLSDESCDEPVEPFPRPFDPKRDRVLPDECLQIYADRARDASSVSVEAKQFLSLVMELRWHRSRNA